MYEEYPPAGSAEYNHTVPPTLRAVLAERCASSTPSIFPIPKVQTAFAHDGTPADPRGRRGSCASSTRSRGTPGR